MSRRLDCWFETHFFGKAPMAGTVLQPTGEFVPDAEDKRAGDFSLKYTAQPDDGLEWLGFTVSPYLRQWKLTEEWNLHLWIKAELSRISHGWRLQFVDTNGRKAEGMIHYSGRGWEEFPIPLSGLRAEQAFDFGKICAFQIAIELREGDQVWLDDVYYFHPRSGDEIGVSEKRVEQRIHEERLTRKLRVDEAFRKGIHTDFSGRDRQLFDQLWVGERLEEVNRELCARWIEEKEKALVSDIQWSSLIGETRMVSFYFCFGSKSTFQPGKLDPVAEQALLELMWDRSKYTNDISLSKQSTWWMAGSENHDINHKTFCLLTSAIFMNEPEYASRIYPNTGKGYGFQFDRYELGTARGVGSDGKRYMARDHYAAWVAFFKQYFTERARKGFFLERASEAYMKHTLSSIYALFNFCMDEELRRIIRMFLDLVWTDWAVEQISGIRGGPKTRHHYHVGSRDSMTPYAIYHMGGPGLTHFNCAQMLLSDYEFPSIVWELALDREGLGCFAFVSRGVGEEEFACPRPPGTEYTLMCNTESRFVKYSWVTPDYILGTQMDHPYAVHSHLSALGRWQGLICGADPGARLVTVALDPSPRQAVKGGKYSLELMCHSVQHRQVLITQQRRRWMQANPALYPSYDDIYDREFGLYFGAEWDQLEETGGWIFARKGNVYVAVRILLCRKDDNPLAWAMGNDKYKGIVQLNDNSYSWNEDQTIVRLHHKYSPIIIEAGRKADFPALTDFRQTILGNRLELYPTVVTQDTAFLLVYQGAGKDAKEIYFNAANTDDIPRIGGEGVNYSYPYTFQSPYVQSEYNSGVIRISKHKHELVLNFNNLEEGRLL
jgi:hypothetical protein